MDSRWIARWIDRAAPFVAAVLLALRVDWFRGARAVVADALAGQFQHAAWKAPDAAWEVGAFVAAVCLVVPRWRGFGATLGLVAAAIPATALVTVPRRRWHEMADAGWIWTLTTATLLLAVLWRERWAPRRRSLPSPPKRAFRRPPAGTILDVVPSWTIHVGAGALLWLADSKIQTMGYLCGDDGSWARANMAMTSAELSTGLLALLPRTRLVGAWLGASLMSATALFALWADYEGVSWRSCHCFGAIEAPWRVHFLLALAVAAVLAAAAVREATFRASRPVERTEASARCGSILDDVRRRIRRRGRSGARHAWAGPPAGLAVLLCALPLARRVVEAFAKLLLLMRPPSWGDLVIALFAAAEVVGAVLLFDRRRFVRGAWIGGAAVGVCFVVPAVWTIYRWFGPEYADWDVAHWWDLATTGSATVLCVLAGRTRSAARRAAWPPAPRRAPTPRVAAAPRATVP
jgi:hypothetical protein